MNSLFRRLLLLVGVLIYRVGLAEMLIERGSDGIRVLLYHSVGPGGDSCLNGLTDPISVEEFEAHLDFVKRHYQPITLSDFESGEASRNGVLITFDDGYRSVWDYAFHPLHARGIKPIVFLSGRATGNDDLLWMDEITWTVNVHPEVAVPLIKRMCPDISGNSVAAIVNELWTSVPPAEIRTLIEALRDTLSYSSQDLARQERPYLDWSEVSKLADAGWEFGTHTDNHFCLPLMDREAQETEIKRGKDLLEERLGELSAFAYPFGARDGHSKLAAIQAGHDYLMEVGGVNPRPVDPTEVARVPCQGASTPAQLFAQIEVVTPFKAWIRQCFSTG